MCTVEFQISLCFLQVIVQKLEVFTLPFPQCFWLIWATSWPHCSQCFYCPTVQLGSSRQRGLERAGSGSVLVLESRQLQGRAGVTSLGQGHHPAGVGQGPAQGRQSPGMAGQGHSAGQGRGRHRLWGGWIEGRCSPRASTTCLCSQDPEQSRWEIQWGSVENSPFLGLCHSYSLSKQFCFALSLLLVQHALFIFF